MLAFDSFELIICSDADGGLRLSPCGGLDQPACQQLNEAIIAALRAGVPRLEIDLRDAISLGIDVGRVLRPAESLARHLGVEYRTTGDGPGLL